MNCICPSYPSPAGPHPPVSSMSISSLALTAHVCFLHFLVKNSYISFLLRTRETFSQHARPLYMLSLSVCQLSLHSHFPPTSCSHLVSVGTVSSSELMVWHDANAALLLYMSRIMIRESITGNTCKASTQHYNKSHNTTTHNVILLCL